MRAKGVCCLFLKVVLLLFYAPLNCQTTSQERVEIDAHAQTTPFPHFWEQMFGAGPSFPCARATVMTFAL